MTKKETEMVRKMSEKIEELKANLKKEKEKNKELQSRYEDESAKAKVYKEKYNDVMMTCNSQGCRIRDLNSMRAGDARTIGKYETIIDALCKAIEKI